MNYLFSSYPSVRTTLKMSSFRAAFFTSIPLYTLFKIKTAFNFLTFAKKGFIWGYNRRFHLSFRRPIIYVESIAKTCRIGPYP